VDIKLQKRWFPAQDLLVRITLSLLTHNAGRTYVDENATPLRDTKSDKGQPVR